MTGTESNFTVDEYRGIFTIGVARDQELDMRYSEPLTERVGETVGRSACSSVVIDLDRATFLDCSMLGAISAAHALAEEQGKTFVLDITRVAKPSVHRLLGMMHFDDGMFIARQRAGS